MRANTILTAFLVLLLTAGAVWAGEKKACSRDADECLSYMVEKIRKKGWVGIELDREGDDAHPMIAKVLHGGPAETAGIEVGDVLVSVDGVDHGRDNQEALNEIYGGFRPGDTVVYVVRRDGDKRKVQVTLARVPDRIMAEWVGSHMIHHHDTGDSGPVGESVADRD